MATNTSINWGGILKGAAIITAVAVAGVVAYSAFAAAAPEVTGYIAQSENLKIFLSNAVDLATAAGEQIATGWSWLTAQAAAAPAAIVSALGIENTGSLSSFLGNSAQNAHIAGSIGAASVGAAATTIAVPELRGTPLVTQDATNTALASQSLAHNSHNAGMHEATFTAKHIAAEHGQKSSGSWVSALANKAGLTSPSEAPRPNTTKPTPRQASYASQLNEDRTNLEAIIGK